MRQSWSQSRKWRTKLLLFLVVIGLFVLIIEVFTLEWISLNVVKCFLIIRRAFTASMGFSWFLMFFIDFFPLVSSDFIDCLYIIGRAITASIGLSSQSIKIFKYNKSPFQKATKSSQIPILISLSVVNI